MPEMDVQARAYVSKLKTALPNRVSVCGHRRYVNIWVYSLKKIFMKDTYRKSYDIILAFGGLKCNMLLFIRIFLWFHR